MARDGPPGGDARHVTKAVAVISHDVAEGFNNTYAITSLSANNRSCALTLLACGAGQRDGDHAGVTIPQEPQWAQRRFADRPPGRKRGWSPP